MDKTREENIKRFESLMATITRDGKDALMDYIKNKTDFYTAPASTQFHLSCEGGLLQHSLNVYDCLIAKKQSPIWKKTFEEIPEESLIIMSLLHDLCKVNYYDPKVKWFKDESNNWHSYQSYEINDRLPLGHGEKPVILLQQFIRLTGEEIASIRWHMAFSDSGTWISIYEKPAMMKSLEICPLVMVIAMADQFATFLMEKREDPKVCCLIS